MNISCAGCAMQRIISFCRKGAQFILKEAGVGVFCVATQVGLLQVCAADDIPISNFDDRSYGNWMATGTAFQKGPASGDLIRTLEIENAVGGGVASSEIEGDGPTGTLTSPAFKLERTFISFLIGGGNYEHHTCLNLLVGGKVVRSATGRLRQV